MLHALRSLYKLNERYKHNKLYKRFVKCLDLTLGDCCFCAERYALCVFRFALYAMRILLNDNLTFCHYLYIIKINNITIIKDFKGVRYAYNCR